jgi:Acetyltransferase (GNAT) domain
VFKRLVAATQEIRNRRRARRRPSGFEFVLAHKIDFVNASDWDQLATKSIFLSRDYLRVLELYSPDNLTMRYAMAYADGVPAAIVLLQRIEVSGDRLRKKTNLNRLRDKPVEQIAEHLLVCGNVFIWGPRSASFNPSFDSGQLWGAVGEAIYRLRRADKLLGESNLIMVKDFADDDDSAHSSLRLLGYRSVETQPDMVLAILPSWKTYDDYLSSLTSSYRSSAKKLLKDCATQNITFRLINAAQMLAVADQVQALYLQVHEGQGLRLATLDSLYLPAMAQILGDRFRCKIAEQNARLVGFVTVVLDHDTAIGYYIGYDKLVNATAPIYLSLLGGCVGDAIEMGAAQLSLGRTALEPKAKMGCKPVPIACGVKHRVSALNPFVTAITRNVNHDEPPERSPFKVATPTQ